jgi:DNA repair exonuclease SbcCD ATPase subunit
MENFIMDICFRVALGQLSFSPRSNLFIIDEGVSVLDKSHLASLDTFLNFLRQVYDHTILISHIEGIGDYTENHMTVVTGEDGCSTLVVNY